MAHEAGLEADVGVAHLPLDLRLGDQGRHGVDDNDVQAAGADEHVRDLQGLLAGVRLGDQEVVGVHAQGLGVDGVEGVLGVDEGGVAPGPLGAGDGVQGHGGLARGLRSEDLHNAPARQAANAQGDVQGDRPGGDDGHGRADVIAQAHDRPLAEGLVDLGQGGGQGLGAILSLGGCKHRRFTQSQVISALVFRPFRSAQ